MKIVAERRRKLASYEVAGVCCEKNKFVLKGRWNYAKVFQRPFRTRRFAGDVPATMWLANFRRSFGAKESGGKNCFALDSIAHS
jgi:hypothetical protein